MTKKATARLSAAASAKVLEELEEWRVRANRADEEVQKLVGEAGEHRGRIRELEKAFDEARGKITEREKDLMGDLQSKERAVANLKRKLFACLQELWATKGYLARVAEDDEIKELGPKKELIRQDLLVAAQSAQPATQAVSRRQGPGILAEGEPDPQPRQEFGRDRPPPPTPWFNL